jgi:hypothetical protein
MVQPCAGGTQIEIGGWGMGGVGLGRISEGIPHYPLCRCCATQPNLADLHAHNALMSNVGQRCLNFYIVAAEQ